MCRSDITPLEDICKRCQIALGDEYDNWCEATQILTDRPKYGNVKASFPDMTAELAEAEQN